jgi:hypothetical protein
MRARARVRASPRHAISRQAPLAAQRAASGGRSETRNPRATPKSAPAAGAIAGLFCINPDGGDYEVWVPEAEAAVARWQGAFEAGGARLSLRRLQGSYFITADIDPATAVGQPAEAGGLK